MKKFCFFLSALFTAVLFSADPCSPGGLAVDWSKYVSEPVKVKAPVNLTENGSFEMPGTDISGWRGKGHWVGWAHVHTPLRTPEIKAFRGKFSKAAIRKVVQNTAADGKWSAFLKTPDSVRSMIKPLPLISNKIAQKVPLKPEKRARLYTLSLMTKGKILPTVPSTGCLVVQMQGLKLNTQKRYQNVGRGVLRKFGLTSSWSRHQIDLQLPAGCDGVNYTISLYGVGEAYLDDIQLYPADSVRKTTDRIQVRLSPYALLDNTYCVGEKLPGVMSFTFNCEAKDFRRKALRMELKLPQGFRVVESRDVCKILGHKNNVWQIDLQRLTKVAFTRSWYMLQACSVMIESTLPASEKVYTASYRLVDGAWKGTPHTFKLKVIPAFHGIRPKLFRSAAMLGHEFTFAGAGTRKIADFYLKSGFSCIHGAKPALAKEIKKHGILRYSTNYFLSNGFRLGAAPKTGNARFMMADGTPYRRKICPVEVYKRGPYYRTEVYEKILKKAIVDLDITDVFMTNWEPFYLDSKGCFCMNCRDEFIRYSKGKPSKTDIMAVWPKDLLRKYAEEYFKFRSWQHGRIVVTLHKDAVALGKTMNKESGFVPEISWYCAIPGRNSYCKQYNVKDYMYELPWLEPWGPYVIKRAGEPFIYRPTSHLPTYEAAGMMKKFINGHFKNKKAPGMIAFPHGYQGENWVTEPEAFAFEMLCFFVRGWEGVFGYYFPRGYDYRHWRAVAGANTTIARYENFTFKGRNDNKGVKITPLSPLPEKLHYAPRWEEPEGEVGLIPGLGKKGPIQFQTWRYKGEILVCIGNFWEKGEHFFKLQIAGLAPDKKFGVELSGKGYGNYTGRELARGITLHCGALRWQFVKIGKAVKAEFTEKYVRQLLPKRLPAIRKAVAWEKAYFKKISSYDSSENPVIDYKSIKSVSAKGVTVSASGQNLLVKSPVYSLRIDPAKGGRIHDWKSGKDLFFPESRILGFAVPGIWYPKENAFQLQSGMKLEKISPVADGVEVHLSRILTAKDKPALAGVRFDVIHKFAKDRITSRTQITNLLHDAIELAFRYHNMPALLGSQKGDSGSVRFASGETFRRDFDQRIIRLESNSDPLLEKAFSIVKQQRTAKRVPVRLSAPWSRKLLEFTFPELPHSIVLWDNAQQQVSTFEPIYKRTQIVPGKSAEFVMTATVK